MIAAKSVCSPCKETTVYYLYLFPMLNLFTPVTYFIIRSLYCLVPFTYFAHLLSAATTLLHQFFRSFFIISFLGILSSTAYCFGRDAIGNEAEKMKNSKTCQLLKLGPKSYVVCVRIPKMKIIMPT